MILCIILVISGEQIRHLKFLRLNIRLYKNAWIHKLDSKSVVNNEISKFSK